MENSPTSSLILQVAICFFPSPFIIIDRVVQQTETSDSGRNKVSVCQVKQMQRGPEEEETPKRPLMMFCQGFLISCNKHTFWLVTGGKPQVSLKNINDQPACTIPEIISHLFYYLPPGLFSPPAVVKYIQGESINGNIFLMIFNTLVISH